MMNERGNKIITRVNSRNSTYEIKVIVHEPVLSYSIFFYSRITKDEWESNGKLPPRTCQDAVCQEPYRFHNRALVPAGPASRAEY